MTALRVAGAFVVIAALAGCAPRVSQAGRTCLGFPAEVCARELAQVDQEGRAHAGVRSVRLACTSPGGCTSERGKGTVAVEFADGVARSGEFGYQAPAATSGSAPAETTGEGPVPPSGAMPGTPLPAASSGVLRVEFRVLPVDGRAPGPADLAVVRDIIARRIDATGIVAPVVDVQGTDRIIVELPGIVDAQVVRDVTEMIGRTGRLDIVPIPSGQSPPARSQVLDMAARTPLLSGDALAGATIGIDEAGARVIDLALRPGGRAVFEAWTRDHVGEYVAITLDGEVIAAPRIVGPISGGTLRISPAAAGGISAADAATLVTIVSSGALPFPLEQIDPQPTPASDPSSAP